MYYIEFKSHQGKVETTPRFETIRELWNEVWTWPQEDEYYICIHEKDPRKLELVCETEIEIVDRTETEKIREFLFEMHFHDYAYAKIVEDVKEKV